MANEEVLGPRKTMFVLVIVVGCFAVLWPRILSPLIMGSAQDQLKPNQFDRDAGCCEVIFETEMAVLELVNEVCNSAVGADGKLSPHTVAECRKSVNETCGLDIAAFLKRSENVGKTTKMLLETMKSSNSSCLKEHFGVPVWSLSAHQPLNSWIQQDTLKQERPLMRGAGPHPALRERGRAIPAGAPTPPSRGPVPLPPHARPPPIPGMRPPLGSPGGPVPAPKSSMGFVMPIYTICIIVFFVYTLSKILFKRTGSSPYEPVTPDPQFRRRVFRDDSRSSPETKLVVTAISGLVAEVQQQMAASYAPNQQRQDVQDNHTRPYTNGTVGNNAPVHIVTSEYREPSQVESPESQKEKETSPLPEEPEVLTPEPQKPSSETEIPKEIDANHKDANVDLLKLTENIGLEKTGDSLAESTEDFLNDARDNREELKIVSTQELEGKREKRSTQELLEEALKEDSPTKENDDDQESPSVKVVNMEVTAHAADGGAMARAAPPSAAMPAPPTQLPRPPHEAEDVKAIFLDTEIPQQSRVLVAEFAEDRAEKPAPTKHAPTVVSGKMTLSLIQDAPRDTPDRDLESTFDDFTTASAVTQSAAEKEDNLSEEEIEEEIEVEEIEEEIEEEEEEVPNKSEVVQKTEELKSDAELKQADTEQETIEIANELHAKEDGTSKTADSEIETEVAQDNENEHVEIEEQINNEVETEAVKTTSESKELSELEVEDLKQNDEAVKEEDGIELDQEEEKNEVVTNKHVSEPVIDDKNKEHTIDGDKKTESSKKDVKKNQVKTEESSEEEEEEEED